MSKRQSERDTKSKEKGRALAKRKQDLVISADQQYRIAEAKEHAKLQAMSTSPDLSGSIRLCRALLQQGLDSGATERQQAELLRICHNLSRTQISIILQLGLLIPDHNLHDYGRAVSEVATIILDRHGGADPNFADDIGASLSPQNLVAANEGDEVVEMSGGQTYQHPGYEQSSATLSQSADLQLCRYYIQRSLDAGRIADVILLLRQEMAMAATQLAFGQKSGELLSRTAGREIVLRISNRVSDACATCRSFDGAIDEFRSLLMGYFPNKQIENQ
jgi:hypothetical protein